MKNNDNCIYIAYSDVEAGEQVIFWADSIQELAEKMKTSVPTIYRHLKKNDGVYARVHLDEPIGR